MSSPWPPSTVLTLDSIKKSAKATETIEPTWAPRDVALICFTSGTTGRPKGAAISHTSLIVQSLAKISIVGYGEDDAYLHTAPLCHIGGLSSCIAMLMCGGCHIFIPKFDAESAFRAIDEHRATTFITVPAIMADLVSYARRANRLRGVGTVTRILNGGGSVSEELIKDAASLFPRATIFSAYGMTEACSSLTFMTLHKPTLQRSEERLPSECMIDSKQSLDRRGGVNVGKPAPHVEIRIGAASESTSIAQSVGKVLTRGLHVMVGYWVNNKAIALETDYGWLDTGDIGWIGEDGNLRLVGREKDRLKSGGENVYPEEVEAVISQHPGVSKAVVIGVPDTRLSEKVVACVSIKEEWKWVEGKSDCSGAGKELSAEILQSHCRQRNLSRFKIPKAYVIWKKPFPVTSTGKIRREDVKREVMYCMQLHSNL